MILSQGRLFVYFTLVLSFNNHYSFKLYSDKMFPIFIVVLLASCLSNVDCQRPPYPPPPQYPTPSPVQDYNPDIGQTNVGDYGVNKDPYCHKVEKVIFENKCEPYTEKTCWTQNQETCQPELFKNCTGVIETNIERVCFNVNE